MNDTYGPSSPVSSANADLQQSLESRLQARMAGYGSPEYALTWKEWDMQSGPPICALRASVRRTSGKGYTGWPTPQTFDASNDGKPRALRYKGNAPSEAGNTRNPDTPGSYRGDLKDYAALSGWVTPSSRDWKDSPGMAFEGTNPDGSLRKRTDLLPRQVYGLIPSGDIATTTNTGGLNPAFPCWLMGFPTEWDDCGASVTLSSPRSQRSSSKRTKKQERDN